MRSSGEFLGERREFDRCSPRLSKAFNVQSHTKAMKPCCYGRFVTFSVALLLSFFTWNDSAHPSPPLLMPLSESRQCLLVVTPSWTSSTGVLRAFERAQGEITWKQRGEGLPVVVGKKGLGWGRGLASVEDFEGPIKKEGDQRAPAGVFALSCAFGYQSASKALGIKLPYIALTPQIEAINDPSSKYYNQLVQRSSIDKPDWRSSEQMRRADNLYRWGIVIEHNTPPSKGAGSCIFLHVWRGPALATDGCTATAEHNLKEIIAWLDPRQKPVLIQLPLKWFERLRPTWQLP
jgi:D-alanyl-D-alanine dipeptidase